MNANSGLHVPPQASSTRGASSTMGRMAAHRDGARMLAQREGAMPAIAEARARPGKIRFHDKMFFFSQLSVMLSAGVPVAVALDAIARQSERLRLREVLQDVLHHVESGESLSSGLAQHKKVFPNIAVYLVRAGETSGNLPGMVLRLCEVLERDYDLSKKMKSALTYPLVMMSLAFITVVALFTFILPRFQGLYAGREDLLPGSTRALLAIGQFTGEHALALAGGAVCVFVGLTLWLRTERARSWRDTVLLSVPVVGGVIRRFSLARSVRTMGVLLQSGVPVLTALELARDLSSNRRLGEAWEYVRQQVADGSSIHDGMVGQSWFPGTLVQMTAVGEAGGILDGVLVKVGEFYDREAEVAVKDATALIEPAMVVLVGGFVGFIAMSIMLPIFNMSKLVHG